MVQHRQNAAHKERESSREEEGEDIMYPWTKHIKSLLPDWKAKNWQFDLRICPDCNTLQIRQGKVIKEGAKCDNSECETVLTLCTKGKHAGEYMWINENWD